MHEEASSTMLATQERGRTIVSGYLRRPAAVHVSDAVTIDTEHYSAAMASWSLGSLPVSAIEDPNRATVTRYPDVTDRGPGRHLVGLLLSGSGHLITETCTTRLTPGGIVLYCSQDPFVLQFDEPYRYLVTEVPDALLVSIPDRIDLAAACADVSAAPAARLAVDVLSSLPGRADHLSAFAREHLGETVVALLRDAVDDVRGSGAPATEFTDLLPMLLRWIDFHLPDPELSPARIAAAHFISVRYLHRIFERHGVTVGEHVRRRRVERVKIDLLDPRTATQPVSAIGARWGFTDANQLIRHFRAVEGDAPGRWRRAHGGQGSA